jgi:heterodisulfide reductase subunit A2
MGICDESTKMRPKALPRIGVVLCYCGNEIREALDFVQIEEYVRALPGVVYFKADAYPCSRPGIADLIKAIKESKLERIVIAGCTPRLHGKLVAEACESAGLNQWFVDVANVREHCSRVHKDKTTATEKAKALIGASVRKVGLAKPYEPVTVSPKNSVLVIGGGVSGLSAAAELENLNHEVTLVEKNDVLGGMLLQLAKPYPYSRPGRKIVEEKISRIKGKVKILKRTELVSLRGGPGQYVAKLSIDGKTDEQEVGAVVVATGADCVGLKELLESPSLEGLSGFGGRILSQIDVETELCSEKLTGVHSILFVDIPVPRLSHPSARIYSVVALKNAATLKETSPKLEICFLFKDLAVDVEREFRRAQHVGVKFVRLDDEKTIEVVKNGLRVGERAAHQGPVRADKGAGGGASGSLDSAFSFGNAPSPDSVLSPGSALKINADVIVLPTLLRPPQGSRKLAELLRIPVDMHGFFIEPHIKLRPGDFVEKGIFVAGCCHSPASILECISQGIAAASRASRFVGGEIVRAPLLSRIDSKVCRGCSRCAEACRWDAIEMVTLENGLKLALVDEALCTGCGVCSTVCINGAPSLAPVGQDQIKAMVEVLGG